MLWLTWKKLGGGGGGGNVEACLSLSPCPTEGYHPQDKGETHFIDRGCLAFRWKTIQTLTIYYRNCII